MNVSSIAINILYEFVFRYNEIPWEYMEDCIVSCK